MQTRKILHHHISVPEKIDLYVFGSYVQSNDPGDIDLIIVYDKETYPGGIIFKACEKMLVDINKILDLPIHATYLSYEEESSIKFVEEVGAQLIKK